jgi:F-type H+-transporting ATPase subunit a
MHLSSDELIFWQYGFANLNLTIVTTWGLMLLMTVGAWLVTKKLNNDLHISRWQHVLEVITLGIKTQVEEVGLSDLQSRKYIAFIGTLFLFILVSN